MTQPEQSLTRLLLHEFEHLDVILRDRRRGTSLDEASNELERLLRMFPARAALPVPALPWRSKTSIRDGSPTGRFVVDWIEAGEREDALRAALPVPALDALRLALEQARVGLEVLHSPHFGWGCNAATCSGQAGAPDD